MKSYKKYLYPIFFLIVGIVVFAAYSVRKADDESLEITVARQKIAQELANICVTPTDCPRSQEELEIRFAEETNILNAREYSYEYVPERNHWKLSVEDQGKRFVHDSSSQYAQVGEIVERE